MKIKNFLSWLRGSIIATFILLSTGCKISDSGVTPHLSADEFFATFALEHHAINLSTVAPYDTVTLKTNATMADGSPVSGEIVYSVSNPAITVTNGVLKAESAIPYAVVRVTLKYGTVTRTDSAAVSVIATTPTPLNDFGFRPSSGDSAKIAVGGTKAIPLIRNSAAGSNLSGIYIAVRSSDTTIAKIKQSLNNLNISSIRPGRVMLYVSTYAYGFTKMDSLQFTVGWPLLFQNITVEKFRSGSTIKILDFAYQNITVGVGGCVAWANRNYNIDIDMKFDDAAAVMPPARCEWALIYDRTIGGDIAPYRSLPVIEWDGTEEGLEAYMKAFFSTYQARSFSTAGIYQYTSTLHGSNGVVRVCDERNDTTCAPTGIGAWY